MEILALIVVALATGAFLNLVHSEKQQKVLLPVRNRRYDRRASRSKMSR